MKKNKIPNKVYVALPAMDEADYLSEFIECLRNQSFRNFIIVVCVNQPDDWWEDEDRILICQNNKQSIEFLNTINDLDIQLIDRSSTGKGWKGKRHGVGWARKTIMDQIANEAEESDIIISLDADTTFGPDYFSSVIGNFKNHPQSVAISIPYYHELTGDAEKDRAILRYEIYMRYFAINMWRIGSPYSFTAIGSAIALPVLSYKTIGGITPHKSGEDFYFLQKLKKFGNIICWNEDKVYPAARYSERVGFGTGPAMIKGREGDWNSYPIYPFPYFDEVELTYDLFTILFKKDVETPMDTFNEEKFGDKQIWSLLRENFKQEEKFVRACHHKLDGFRVFQYLKWRNPENKLTDEEKLIRFLEKFYPERSASLGFDFNKLIFAETSVKNLDELRNMLVEIEVGYQKG
ncbi:MAG: glycosyltransferase [Bacteroidales bacterium]|nr:glycosyltransferase [Bacteroidales bacterium]